ncbi:MAG: ABC transporter substrate-binding protein, partial [Dehalococcoidia bacterium]|nr:ABC transporter substrate-binding protein [Dehalococcoidia bacterium]
MDDGRRVRFLLIPLSLVALAALAFAACGDDEEEGKTPAPGETPAPTVAARPGNVDAVIVWGAEEIDKFDAMTKPWIDDTGNSLDFTSTRDINTLLTTRVAGGNPPDVSFPPALGIFRDLAREGSLKPLSDCPGLEDKVRADYPQSVVDLGTVDGTLYGVAMKAGYKANVWYSPKAFAAKGYEVPTTWDELIALANKIVADGGTPFSDAEEIGGGSGFPGSDWVQQIVINQWGPDVYDQWVAHDIPYNDDRIKQSWQMFGDIILNPDYILGGTDKALATRFSEGAIPLFKDPPEAYMHVMGSFDSAFITNPELGFPAGLVAGEDFDLFPFPVINPDFPSGVTGDLNMRMMFNNDPETCSFV